ncbi:AzlD family protein [Roseitalea porphyridii]|uniref:AzlD family protein n=1 Tax=Roseitalea porphyridii TaxID=1852022 RepID=A0A4P6V4I1_9HYPH|nr:AzlD domain-containing protein [Roseitalea porphyridii]QBK31480.1 AzlD family protein [Roseitalea porphyridii]
MSTTVWIILAGAVATYLTRIGGHAVLSRFAAIPPRLGAALNAVPAAVLTAIVAPYAAFYGLAEAITIAVAIVLALRLPPLAMLAICWALIFGLRQVM